jgi:hypothetical protein
VGKSKIPDKRLRALIDHFTEYRLRNDDFEFPDLPGAAQVLPRYDEEAAPEMPIAIIPAGFWDRRCSPMLAASHLHRRVEPRIQATGNRPE